MSTTDNNSAEKRAKLINFAYLSFLIAWSLGIVYLLAKQFVLKTLLVSSSPGTVFINDFLHFYCAGQMVLQGQASNVYDPQVQMLFMDKLISPLHVSQVFYIQYVPFVFLLSAPLALLSVEAAFWCWTAFSLACMLATLLLLRKFLPRFSQGQSAIIFLGLFATLANFECLQLGQLGNYLLLLVTVYLVAIAQTTRCRLEASAPRQNRMDIAGGICLALSSMKPHYAILLAIPALIHKRWLLLFTAAVTELGLLGASGVVLGWKNIISYPKIVLEADTNPQYGGVHPEHMVSIRGLFARFLSDPVALKASIAVFFLGAAWLMFNTRNRSGKRKSIEMLFSLTIVLLLVVSPHTNLYDCVLLVLPAYLLLPKLNLLENCSTSDFWTRLYQLLLVLYPLLSAIMFVLWEYVPLVSQNPLPFFFVHLTLLASLAISQRTTAGADSSSGSTQGSADPN